MAELLPGEEICLVVAVRCLLWPQVLGLSSSLVLCGHWGYMPEDFHLVASILVEVSLD